jgi:hypothetical protein
MSKTPNTSHDIQALFAQAPQLPANPVLDAALDRAAAEGSTELADPAILKIAMREFVNELEREQSEEAASARSAIPDNNVPLRKA